MKIVIETIAHEEQRYPTCGDYFEENGVQRVLVSNMGNEDYEFLVAVHELVELWLTKRRGISEESISAFDKTFEKQREVGMLDELNAEAGDDPNAPYQNEHNFATGIERMVCAAIGIKWYDYEEAIKKLP